MQIVAPFLALAALAAASPHMHHRHIHQKKSPMPHPDMNEALKAGLPAILPAQSKAAAAAAAAATPSPTPSASPAEVVAPSAPAVPSVAAPAPVASAVAPVIAQKNVVSAAVNNVAAVAGRLSALSVQQGRNSETNNGAVWIGNDGQYTNTFNAGSDLILTIWGNHGSWVNAVQPHLTVPMSAGQSITVSFADGQTGGWAGIYPDTITQNGQIMNTWGEYTFKAPYSTVDVSREVKMSGKSMSIQTPKCITDMNTCVFVCTNGQDSCWHDYTLKNCENGSQAGATNGVHEGAASGGCSNMGSSAHLTTNLG